MDYSRDVAFYVRQNNIAAKPSAVGSQSEVQGSFTGFCEGPFRVYMRGSSCYQWPTSTRDTVFRCSSLKATNLDEDIYRRRSAKPSYTAKQSNTQQTRQNTDIAGFTRGAMPETMQSTDRFVVEPASRAAG